MGKMKKLIVLDFDGVVRIKNKPAKDIFSSLDELKEKGYKIIILTARNLKEVKSWIKKNGGRHFKNIRITNRKPAGGCAYVDDRAVKFTTWRSLSRKF